MSRPSIVDSFVLGLWFHLRVMNTVQASTRVGIVATSKVPPKILAVVSFISVPRLRAVFFSFPLVVSVSRRNRISYPQHPSPLIRVYRRTSDFLFFFCLAIAEIVTPLVATELNACMQDIAACTYWRTSSCCGTSMLWIAPKIFP